MLFNSIEYFVFLFATLLLYCVAPVRYRWAILLAASGYFYAAWNAKYIALLFISIMVDYCAGSMIGRSGNNNARFGWLLFSISTNLAMLFTFKYFNFFIDIATAIAGRGVLPWDLPVSDLFLPVGISFYTFQSMSYSVDVYSGRLKPGLHFGRFALYVVFFPQLIAGPIERATRLLPQLSRPARVDYFRAVSGMKLIAWGLFKKVVIADKLALYVDAAYSQPSVYGGGRCAIATVFFAYQIYCDFSGYSDMAVGSARIFGVDLMRNFNNPYHAASIGDFWQRWHISLSTWFRDYVYVPLGGSRRAVPRWYFNVAATFLISGLWHGASWTFVVWGALHGTYFIFGLMLAPYREVAARAVRLDRVPRVCHCLGWLLTTTFVMFTWIFFRADNLASAYLTIAEIGSTWSHVDLTSIRRVLLTSEVKAGCALIVLLESVQIIGRRFGVADGFRRLPGPLRWLGYITFVWAIFELGVFGEKQFIYFQF